VAHGWVALSLAACRVEADQILQGLQRIGPDTSFSDHTLHFFSPSGTTLTNLSRTDDDDQGIFALSQIHAHMPCQFANLLQRHSDVTCLMETHQSVRHVSIPVVGQTSFGP
jgi:hypothetical protein